MDISVFEKQYNKTLNMIYEIIVSYDEDLWHDNENYQYPAWQIAYHGIYYTNIYCSSKEEKIVSWPKEKEYYHFFGNKPWPPFEKVTIETPYSINNINEFIEFVREQVPNYLKDFSPDEKCWPFWYDETQFEFHINNIRHLQHHTAEILERHNNLKKTKYSWQ